jgi:hypothetical protein
LLDDFGMVAVPEPTGSTGARDTIVYTSDRTGLTAAEGTAQGDVTRWATQGP